MVLGRRCAGVALAATALVASCGADATATVDEDRFAAAMIEEFGATEEQAQCITDYVFEDYDAAEIEVLVDDGMAALPQARWEPYLNASAACLTHDEPLDGSG